MYNAEDVFATNFRPDRTQTFPKSLKNQVLILDMTPRFRKDLLHFFFYLYAICVDDCLCFYTSVNHLLGKIYNFINRQINKISLDI